MSRWTSGINSGGMSVMWALTTAPSSRPPKPGAGSTGRTRLPRATLLVGAIGRLCQISSSANNIGDEGNAHHDPSVWRRRSVRSAICGLEGPRCVQPWGASDVLAHERAELLGGADDVRRRRLVLVEQLGEGAGGVDDLGPGVDADPVGRLHRIELRHELAQLGGAGAVIG